MTAIKQTVTVQPGGLIEVRSPDLRAGDEAEVIVLVEPIGAVASDMKPSSESSMSSWWGAAKGSFKNADEVNAYIRELRDEWDR